jgi:WD40 repeat protein
MSPYVKFASREWPFIGLRPFEYSDHEYFFGRDRELDVLRPQVTKNRFVTIVGGSGSGKSSLIRAGLQPRLEKAWSWIEMRPGDAPIRNLASALADLTGKVGDLSAAWADRFERVLAKSSFGISEALAWIPIIQDSRIKRVLLLIDQFEELFRFANLRSPGAPDAVNTERRDEATAFVRLLLTAAKSSQVPIHVVVTMRSDFIGDCASFHGLPEAVSGCQFLVPGMTRDQREAVIRKPVYRALGEIDSDLVQRALNDTNEEIDQLPILQHAMMKCWERASERNNRGKYHRPHLTSDDYKTVGGVEKALSLHANEILDKITAQDPNLRLVTKRVFQALTETDDEGRSIRRPQRFRDLVQCVQAPDAKDIDHAATNATRTVIVRFASPDCSFLRIIPPAEADEDALVDDEPAANGGSDIDDDAIIDIGHEALIRRWDKLMGDGKENWMHEEQEDAERCRDLLRYVQRGAIIPAEDLPSLKEWWTGRRPNAFWARRYAKHKDDNFNKVEDVLRRSGEKALAALEESKRYETRVLAMTAEAIRVPPGRDGAADSLAMALLKPAHLPDVPEYIKLLYDALGELREKRRIYTPGDLQKQVFALSFAPGGKLLAAAVSGALLLYDADTAELVHSEITKGGWVVSLRWSPDGKRIYVGTSPIGTIFSVCSIGKLRKYFNDCDDETAKATVEIGSDEYQAGSGAWSSDGKWIVVAAWQRRASLWNTWNGESKGVIGDEVAKSNLLDGMTCDIAASADGQRIAIGAASRKIHIFKPSFAGNKEPFFKLEKSLAPIDLNSVPYSLAFDPKDHDRLLAAYMPSPQMAVWEIGNGSPTVFAEYGSGTVWRVAFDPKGKFAASATNDAVVRLWTDINSDGSVLLRGHLASAFSVDISPESGDIASGSNDGTIRLWSRDAPLSPKLLGDATSIAFASNKFTLQDACLSVTGNAGEDHQVVLPEGFGPVCAVAVSANGAAFALVPCSGRPLLVTSVKESQTAVSGSQITVNITLPDVEAIWSAVAFIENDTGIAARTQDGRVFAWPFYFDVRSLKELARDHLPLVRDENGEDRRLEVSSSILRSSTSLDPIEVDG